MTVGPTSFLMRVNDEKLCLFFENYPTLGTHSSTPFLARSTKLYMMGLQLKVNNLCEFGQNPKYVIFSLNLNKLHVCV